ncbi:ATP phosphoribosyltransferase [Candidatus Poribacteria bacterium]|nr:ATP phosphoribosyltransferase [Candidatus Poribacteria bacterium]MYA55261.1 ATP phosphoribosyltransferase [Candidatus Poribacteria bacterium]
MKTESQRTLKLLLPKGSLQGDTLEMFQRAGYELNGYTETDRSYRATFRNDNAFQIKISRPQEIPVYVGMDDFYDVGITGQDWVEETDADVEEILPLEYGHIDIILAVREERDDINTFDELVNFSDRDIRISTEYLNIAEKYILEKTENRVAPTILTPWKRLNTLGSYQSPITLMLSFGATEGKPPEEADAIIDNSTTSRRTLKANELKVIELLRESESTLIANPKALRDSWKHGKIEELKQTLRKGLRRRRSRVLPGHI